MDPLSGAIDELGLHGVAFRRFDARGKRWALRYRARVSGLHLVVDGACELSGAVDPVSLRAGDLALVLGGSEHVLGSGRSARAGPVHDASELAARQASEEVVRIGRAADPSACVLVCGVFTLDAVDHPMLHSLPDVLVLSREVVRDAARLAAWVEALVDEVTHPREGTAALVRRLVEVVLVEAVRVHATSAGECPSAGWFRGLRDPSLGRALSAFHRDVAAPWTVESLAREAGKSRTAFSERFAQVLGEPPLAYVRRWRLFHARRLLRTTEESLDAIAAEIGYGSAAALSAAFQRDVGTSPGAFRAEARGRRSGSAASAQRG